MRRSCCTFMVGGHRHLKMQTSMSDSFHSSGGGYPLPLNLAHLKLLAYFRDSVRESTGFTISIAVLEYSAFRDFARPPVLLVDDSLQLRRRNHRIRLSSVKLTPLCITFWLRAFLREISSCQATRPVDTSLFVSSLISFVLTLLSLRLRFSRLLWLAYS